MIINAYIFKYIDESNSLSIDNTFFNFSQIVTDILVKIELFPINRFSYFYIYLNWERNGFRTKIIRPKG